MKNEGREQMLDTVLKLLILQYGGRLKICISVYISIYIGCPTAPRLNFPLVRQQSLKKISALCS